MSTADNRCHIAFNGEIYNHLALRTEIPGVEFSGHSDTETLLQLLTGSGIDSVEKLNGIFGFAYLDLAQRKLHLVRDRFGVKPLYYSIDGRHISFASEIRPLLALHPVGIDLDSLATLLRLRYTPSPDTLFAGIRRVRPGHIVTIDLSAEVPVVKECPYVAKLPGIDTELSFGDSVARYGEYFERAIQRQLMSDVEIGILLSGGVDSALVAALAQKKSAQPLKAFTIGFDDAHDGADETQDASETAAYLGLEHFTAQLGFDDFLDTLRDCVGIVEEPLATTSIVPMHYLAQLAGRHVKVVMSGQGADEPLGGYVRYQAELYRRFVPWWIASAGAAVVGASGIKDERVRRGLNALAPPNELDGFLAAYEVFSAEEISRLIGRDETRAKNSLAYVSHLLGCEGLQNSATRMMSLDLRLNLSDDLLLYTDKLTMRQSLECRVPMLDADLIGLVESMPCEHRLKKGRTKIVHKAFAEQVLPGSIIHREKKGFLSPTRAWFRDGDRLRELLLDGSSAFKTYFDTDEVERVIAEHGRGYNRERHIFLLLCLRFWIDEFI